LGETKLTPGAKQIVRALMQNDWPACSRLKPTPAQAGELLQFLHGFLIFYLGRLPKGRTTSLTDDWPGLWEVPAGNKGLSETMT
jgi:hypothetical protein